jgi:hypothetical protein
MSDILQNFLYSYFGKTPDYNKQKRCFLNFGEDLMNLSNLPMYSWDNSGALGVHHSERSVPLLSV